MRHPVLWLPLAVFVAAAAAGFHMTGRIFSDSATPPGRWRPADPAATRDDTTPEEHARLAALPYLAGTRRAPSRDGVVVHVRERAWAGLNFVVSADAPAAELIDMEGSVLRRWTLAPEAIWPEYGTGPMQRRARYWRRARLMEDGGVIALYEGAGLARLDAGSAPVWSKRGEFHHDFDLDDAGNLYALERRQQPGGSRRYPLLLDWIVTLDREGALQRGLSIEECFLRSPYAAMIRDLPREGDIFHTNSVAWIDGRLAARSPIFARGNLLISQRNTDIVAIIDPSARRVVWAARSPWRKQHDPVLLDSGWVLLFDNMGPATGSRVIELDPMTGAIRVVHAGDPDHPFYSETCGVSQRLENGNTLITESDPGRALEITPDGTVVWEYLNPHRAGPRGELIATLFEVTRIPIDAAPLKARD